MDKMLNFQPINDQKFLYRLAEPNDLPVLIKIYNQSILTKQSTAVLTPFLTSERQAWFDEHQNPNRPLIVAVCRSSQQVVAYGSFSDLYAMPAYHISSEISIYVDDNHKSQGLGKKLLEVLLSIAPDCGIQQVVAKIFAHNPPSLQLFKKYGFAEWGYLPKVCDMDGFLADVVILGKTVVAIT